MSRGCKELWTAGISYQEHTEAAKTVLPNSLSTSPVAIVFVLPLVMDMLTSLDSPCCVVDQHQYILPTVEHARSDQVCTSLYTRLSVPRRDALPQLQFQHAYSCCRQQVDLSAYEPSSDEAHVQ